jgi:diaminohydroxyphosphoribosylaminopyrimidine deaminase/5-amino-6-(5-phosphoribosylamino)uracil reductase
VIAESGVRSLVVGIRDPHPRVDGAGLAIVRAAGVDVVDEVCARAIRHQLAPWITHYHPHEPARRARELGRPLEETAEWLTDFYGLAPETALALARIAQGR